MNPPGQKGGVEPPIFSVQKFPVNFLNPLYAVIMTLMGDPVILALKVVEAIMD